MSSNNKYILLDKVLLEKCLKDLGNLLKKRLKKNSACCELVIVGGASIILNYGFRMSTLDIDCSDTSGILVNEIVNEIADKYGLPTNWINTDFTKTTSYSSKINQYSSYYKTYGNGALAVRTIKDQYLLAMKIVSARKYKMIILIFMESSKNVVMVAAKWQLNL